MAREGWWAETATAPACMSAVLDRPVRADVAMTGKMSLKGRVLAIGGTVAKLEGAKSAADMGLPGWRLHPLTSGHWAVWVNGNWRLTFDFDGEDAVLVDYRDYH